MFTIKELVFIDRNLTDIDALLAGLRLDVEAILLSPAQTAPAQIARAVAGRTLDAVHIVAHGRPGEVNFGAGVLALETIGGHATHLATIGHALGDDGSLLLWSCETGQGERGAAFLEALALATGAHVGASSGRVGAAALGGRWQLDEQFGDVALRSPLTAQGVAGYAGVMAIVNATANEDIFTGLGGANNTSAGDDTIVYTAANQVDNTLADPANGIPRKQDSIDGGAGFDTIQIGAAVTIDFGKASLVAPVAPAAIFLSIEGLAFTTGPSGAKLLAEQFGAGLISNNLLVTGAIGSTQTINITFLDASAAGGAFDASAWTFANWTSGTDIIDIKGSAENDVITGTTAADTIDGSTGNDTIKLADGYFAAGESINGGTNVVAGTDADAVVLTNATTVDFTTGVLTNIELLTGSAGNDLVTMSFAQWGGIATAIDLGAGINTLNVVANLVGTLGGGAVGIPATISNVTTGNLIGTGGNDAITISGAQLDAIIIGAGTIDLGAGTDTINLSSTSADLNTLGATDASITGVEIITVTQTGGGTPVTISLSAQTEAFTITGGAAADSITGGLGADIISGGGGADTIAGGAGADTITGGAGADSISAGDGNDTINLASGDFVAGESIDGGAGTDAIVLISNVTVDLSVGTITGVETLTGSASSDTVSLSATQWSNFTTIDLVGANNTLNVVASGDISAAVPPTPILGNITTGNFTGTAGDNTIRLTGAQLDAIIIGAGTIDLGVGAADTINLTSISADLNILGAANNNSIAGVEAISAATAAAGVTITLSAQTEAFTITGSNSADSISGGAGADTINGGGGNDSISGGTGADTLSGGSNGDVFNFAAGDSALTVGAGGGGGGGTAIGNVSGYDVISDFTPGSVAGVSDTLGITSAAVATNASIVTNINSTLELNTTTKANPLVAASHNIVNGIIAFDDVEAFATAFPLTTTGDVAAAVDYLQRNNIGGAGFSVAFTATVAGVTHTYVYIQGDAAGTVNTLDELIDLPNVTAASISAAANQISVHVTPVAVADTLAATEDTPVTYTAAELLGNDIDAPSIFSVTSGTGGSVVLNGDGTVSFTPNANFNGAASFSYIATEGALNSNSAAVTVNVAAVNDAPVAVADVATAVEAGGVSNATLGTNPAGNVLANDTDVDNGDTKAVTATTGGTVGGASAGAHGTLTLNADGSYSYALNNADVAVQALRTSAQTLTDAFTYTMADAAGATSSTTLTVTIQGANDAPLALADVATAVETGGVANGTLGTSPTGNVLANDTDVDGAANGETKTVSAILGGTVGGASAGAHGTLTLNANGSYGYAVNNADVAVQALNAGQTLTDAFTYTMTDLAGATSSTTLTVTIQGANDAAILSSAVVALTETNAALTTGGTLTITDVDSPATFVAQTNAVGSNGTFSITTAGAWTYTANSAFDNLNVGTSVSDTFLVASADGTTTSVQVTINGTNDAAILSSAVVALTETNAALTTGGTLTITDVDSPATFVAQTNAVGANGLFSITTAGAWTYTANSVFNNLNVGTSVSDTFTVASADGTTTTVQVTINGTNDAAILSSAVVALTETNAALTTGGTLTITDADSPATFVAQTNAGGANGLFSITTAGSWTYTANSAFNNLNVGTSVSDTFTVTSADGTTTSVQVTINGTNDAAILSSAVAVLAETNAALTTGGTLTVTDVDSPATFVAQTNVAGTNGHFSITSAGAWSYAANSAFDNLNVGTSVSDSFTVAAADGTTTLVQVTIDGTNDAAILSSAVVALAETNVALTTGGTLTITDVDSPATFVVQTNVAGTNGHFSITSAGVWTYAANSAFDNLNIGTSVSDSFTVASADGTTTSVQVTINGTNDAAILSSAVVALTETNAALTTGGTLTITDVDSPATFVVQTNVAGADGHFSITSAGVWTYAANSAFDALNVGQSVSDIFTVASADGTTTSVQVTISGTNDSAILSSAVVGLTETNTALTSGGTLTITDADSPATFVAQTNVAGTNGHFSITSAGVWTYAANSAFDNLNVGASVSDTFTVASADGTTTPVQVTINGTNDAAILSSAVVALTETNAALTTGGTLTITDVDNQATFVAQTNVAGVNGHFSITSAGAWTYAANSVFDNLNVGASVSDTFTVASADGTTTPVQVTINGTNDAAILSSAVVALTETNAALTTGGTLTITDVDSPATFVAQTNVAGTNGHFSITSAGAWTYAADSAFDNLNVGQSVSDTFAVASADGTTTLVQVTINGTNDAAVISGTITGEVTEAGGVANAIAGTPTATGTLTDTDVDNPANTFTAVAVATASAGGFGIFTMTAGGLWTYTLNNANPAVQALNVGGTLTDTFTVSTVDGTARGVAITISGTNDAAVLSSATLNVTEGNTAAAISGSGVLTIGDVDSPAIFVTQTNTAGTYGSFSIDTNGAWSYTASSAHNELVAGTTYNDTFAVASADGTTTSVVVNILGTANAAGGGATVFLTEANTAAAISTAGTLINVAAFVAQPGTAGSYGTFSIGTDGAWSYTASSAHDKFVAGTVYNETFAVARADGSITSVVINITGTNDAAVISGTSTGAMVEAGGVANTIAGTPTATGTLTDTDVDNTANTFTAVATATASAGGFGTFTTTAGGVWTYTLNNANATVQALNVGGTLTDTFTVTTVDGTAQVVTLTINGTNDAAVILGTSTGAVTEAGGVANAIAGTPSATGTLTDTDVDNAANTFHAVAAGAASTSGFGTYAMTAAGVWTYTLDNANATVQALKAVDTLTDSFTVTTADGTAQVVQVTINGTNDAAIVSSAVVALTETNAALTTGGTLTITDVDSPATFAPQTNVAGANGHFSITSAGVWSYAANSAFDNLSVDTSVSDTFTAASADGTTTSVQVTINGTNDAAILSSAVVALAETNAALTTSGTLTITDVDSPATFVAQTNAVGANGTFSITTAGAWTYTANSAFNNLNVGASVSDTFTVASADGTTTTVQVTINGTNDAAILSSAVVALTETNAALTAGGTLTITDVDSPATYVPQTDVAGTNGHFSITSAGAWSYAANIAFDNLNVGTSVSDMFTVASADGTTTSVQVTINGTNDAAVLSSAVVALTETNAALTTGGTLTITDVDSPATFVAQTNVAGTNGHFSITSAGAWTYAANSAFDSLNVGQSVSDIFTVASADGTTTSVQVTINGTNDAAVILGTIAGAVIEAGGAANALAGTPTATGTLTDTDVDSPANTFTAVATGTASAGGFGAYAMTAGGVWTYTLNNANPAVQALNAGGTLTDSFTVKTVDGTAQVVTVAINGTNDAAVLSSATLNVIEGNTAAAISGSGTLTISDVDSPATFAAQTNSAGAYGSFSIDSNGAWSYTASSAHNELVAGTTYTDAFVVASADGTSSSVVVNILGTANAAVGGATLNLTEADSAAAISTSGSLINVAAFVAQPGTAGNYGTFSIAANGAWSYTASSAHDEFVVGTVYNETFAVARADGTSTSVVINLLGTNDAAVIGGTSAGAVIEAGGAANAIAGAPTATGTLIDSDVDNPANTFAAVAAATASTGGFGAFTMISGGAWTYTLNDANATVQALNTGQTLTDTFTVTTIDDTAQLVTVTIQGANDAAVANNDSLAATEDTAITYIAAQLLGNDTDVDSAVLSIASVTSATGGTAVLNANGTVTFTPIANFNGAANFSYIASDGALNSNSASVSVDVAPVNDAPIGSVTLAGSATEGQTLTAANTLADVDGLGAISYHWQADGSDISGATGSTYLLTVAQVGAAITVVAAYIDGHGTAESVSSSATTAILGYQVGTAGNDQLSGTAFADTLIGQGGDDTLIGQGGSDTLDGGAGNDILYGDGIGGAQVTDGQDILKPGTGADAVYAGGQNDTIILEASGIWGPGYAAANEGSPGVGGSNQQVLLDGKTRFTDYVNGGDGSDTVQLGEGNDAFFLHDALSLFNSSLSLANDSRQMSSTAREANIEIIQAGGGDDIVDLTSADYAIGGVTIDGGAGNDVLWGNAGADKLNGGDGNDILFGGAGNNTLNGGAGADIFQFVKNGSGTTIIEDFQPGLDKIQLFGAADASEVQVALDGDHVTLTWGVEIIILNAITSTIGAGDWFQLG